jgi:hypothetical protein
VDAGSGSSETRQLAPPILAVNSLMAVCSRLMADPGTIREQVAEVRREFIADGRVGPLQEIADLDARDEDPTYLEEVERRTVVLIPTAEEVERRTGSNAALSW